jgi:hypothetical protein
MSGSESMVVVRPCSGEREREREGEREADGRRN